MGCRRAAMYITWRLRDVESERRAEAELYLRVMMCTLHSTMEKCASVCWTKDSIQQRGICVRGSDQPKSKIQYRKERASDELAPHRTHSKIIFLYIPLWEDWGQTKKGFKFIRLAVCISLIYAFNISRDNLEHVIAGVLKNESRVRLRSYSIKETPKTGRHVAQRSRSKWVFFIREARIYILIKHASRLVRFRRTIIHSRCRA